MSNQEKGLFHIQRDKILTQLHYFHLYQEKTKTWIEEA